MIVILVQWPDYGSDSTTLGKILMRHAMHDLGGRASRLHGPRRGRSARPLGPVAELSQRIRALRPGRMLVISTLMTILITKQSETENWSSPNQVITAIYSEDLSHNAEVGEDISKLSSACSDRRDQEADVRDAGGTESVRIREGRRAVMIRATHAVRAGSAPQRRLRRAVADRSWAGRVSRAA